MYTTNSHVRDPRVTERGVVKNKHNETYLKRKTSTSIFIADRVILITVLKYFSHILSHTMYHSESFTVNKDKHIKFFSNNYYSGTPPSSLTTNPVDNDTLFDDVLNHGILC